MKEVIAFAKSSLKMKSFASVAIAASLIVLASPTVNAVAPPAAGADNPNNWPEYHRTFNAWRYSPLEQINKANVKKLKLSWIHQPGTITHGLQATPIVIDGVMYSIGPDNNVFALNAATGKILWRYTAKLDPIVKEVFYGSAS